ncbi:hypothetical protein GE118_03430 [Mycoplasma sp. NEAQ87857]|uniref:hypothetical protein n=1 Tax=Mycoplasma sp. NEAQ87857 TaxID=2683967 RepID=UPI00131862F3|nr:hypothetical protein [Mycoplasma sp. NEAQ87857]QGZ97837.1 hypothetical protein GE118_03430 [Mycoplasma sp. NEAQ87857]
MKKKFLKNMFSIDLKPNIKKLKNLIFIPLVLLPILMSVVSCSRTQEKEKTISKLIIKKYNIDKLEMMNIKDDNEIDHWEKQLNKLKLNTLYASDFKSIGYWPWEFDKQSKQILKQNEYDKSLNNKYQMFYKKLIKNARLLTTINFTKETLPIIATDKLGFLTKKYDDNLWNNEYKSIIDKNILVNEKFFNDKDLKIPTWVSNKNDNEIININYFTGNYIDRFKLLPNQLVTKNEWSDVLVFHQPYYLLSTNDKKSNLDFYQPEIFNKIQSTNPELKINLYLISKDNLKKYENEYSSLMDKNTKHIQESNILIIDLEYKYTSFYNHLLITNLNYVTPLFNKNRLYLVKDIGDRKREHLFVTKYFTRSDENYLIKDDVIHSPLYKFGIINVNDVRAKQETLHQALGIHLSDDEFKNFKLNGIEFLNLDFKKELLKDKTLIKPEYNRLEWEMDYSVNFEKDSKKTIFDSN